MRHSIDATISVTSGSVITAFPISINYLYEKVSETEEHLDIISVHLKTGESTMPAAWLEHTLLADASLVAEMKAITTQKAA